ncbi:ArnT family glycosyltransferase [Alicyclobacillus fastidiosus]|uniref:Glycosyltransferase family 39 protein n=1 Tax=Alicyclobacillus fastidiosus TaxID=392011 RepID=A0ABV5AG13_9BACL|nr:glycosyltransferase family 39 protein [Alicyclobacillus fastidiosus]WEH09482.1 glycosyltransferase family 39 protein [Alicyclobacillus fastidiosus]
MKPIYARVGWKRALLALVLVVSAFLNLYALGTEGYGNSYYAAAIKSMLMNWHNLFYNSFDPNGFITIDKPPVDFWVQALFAEVFGFHGWAMILPQALAGVASVFVLYKLVSRTFGPAAGLISAAVMALTPIAVAVQRTNEVDGLLVFVMLLATWCMWRAVETKRLRWLIWVGVFEGIGFNIKMMEAYLILPALYTFYYFASKQHWKRKLLQVLSMTVVLSAVSFSWAIAVDLTPTKDRPYVGSTQTNSEMALIFGYNGVSRLTGDTATGQISKAASGASGRGALKMGGGTPTDTGQRGFELGATPSTGSAHSGFGPGGMGSNNGAGSLGKGPTGQVQSASTGHGAFNTGTPGVLRLFQAQLSGQISWLLPIALLSIIPLLRNVRWRRSLTRREGGALYFAMWVVPMAVFYSIAGYFHQYYLITMAPGIAALCGIGLVKMWRDSARKTAWQRYLPTVFLVNLVFEIGIVRQYASVRGALITITVVCAAVAATLIWQVRRSVWCKRLGMTFGVIALLVSPGYWAMTPILDGVNASLPAAGPNTAVAFAASASGMAASAAASGDTALEDYLEKHYTATPGSYLVATVNANTAAPIILDTGLPVMAMGGFLGSDPAISVEQLEKLARAGKVKYFLIQSGGAGGLQSKITQWINANCKLVPSSAYESTASSSSTTAKVTNMGGGAQLYEYTGS